MRGADEDEGGDDDVEDGVVGYEHENSATISRQPDVVLRDEQLKQTRMRILNHTHQTVRVRASALDCYLCTGVKQTTTKEIRKHSDAL